MIDITFPGRIPSKKNSKRRIQRGQNLFMVPSEQHEEWHKKTMQMLRGLGVQGLRPPYKVECNFFAPDKRKSDMSNKFESIADALVDAGIIQDDSWFLLSEVCLKFQGVDKENPRVEVHLQHG